MQSQHARRKRRSPHDSLARVIVVLLFFAFHSVLYAGYRDGMNLYQYVRSGPVTRQDPSGRESGLGYGGGAALQEDIDEWSKTAGPPPEDVARGALARLHQRHVGYLYYESDKGFLTGLKPLIWDKLNAALWYWDDYRWGPPKGASAAWLYIRNVMYIKRNPDPYTVFHEAIHAYNDWLDKHEDGRPNEGLAYTAMGMAKGLERLQPVEKQLSKQTPKVKELRKGWRQAWLSIDQVGWPASHGDTNFTIAVSDVDLVASYLAFKVKCSDIARIYNEQKGAQRACVRFFCVPGATATKPEPWQAIAPLKELSGPYK